MCARKSTSLCIQIICVWLMAVQACTPLSRDVCSRECVPRRFASNVQPFTCNDWWTYAQCCNTSRSHRITAGVYWVCTCKGELSYKFVLLLFCSMYSNAAWCLAPFCLLNVDQRLTRSAVAVVASLVLVAAFVTLSAMFYVLFRYVLLCLSCALNYVNVLFFFFIDPSPYIGYVCATDM